MEENFRIAKIVGTPSENSWTQALVIDGFCALVSLEGQDGGISVAKEGKEILVSLEEEYQKKKVKTLAALKELFSNILTKRKAGVTISLVAAELVGSTIYLVSSGQGKVILKRKNQVGTILHPGELVGSLGILEEGDLVVLQVGKFQELGPEEKLSELLKGDLFDETAENMALLIHGQDEIVGAGAILLHFLGTAKQIVPPSFMPKFKLSISRKRGTMLVLSAFLIVVLALSILFALNQKRKEGNMASLEGVYKEASKKYEDGLSLLALNKELARQPLKDAQALLQNKVGDGSSEKKRADLLAKINEALNQSLNINTVNDAPIFFDLSIIRADLQAKMMTLSPDSLAVLDKKQNVVYTILLSNKSYSVSSGSLTNPSLITSSENIVYALDEAGIWQGKNLVVKKDELGDLVALVAFLRNIYALDKKNQQILKFVPIKEGKFSRKNYFSDSAKLDFSEAISMTIDGSIFVMFSDGTIRKYLEGKVDNFVLSGIDTPLAEPTSIFTNKDQDFLYVLDRGNQRVVVLKKNGSYEAQYVWSGIKDVLSFAVSESEKKIFLLSGNKILTIDLK